MSDLDNVSGRAVESLQLCQTAALLANPIVDTHQDLVEALASPFAPSTTGIILSAPEEPAAWVAPPLEPFPSPPRDSIPPTVTSITPGRDAKEVPHGSDVSATFSEAMNPDTLRPETFTLVEEGTPTPVSATLTLSIDRREATLNPTGNLAPGSKHTAMVKGGDAGAKDDEGTPLAQDLAWSFTTAAGADTTLSNTNVAATLWILIVVAFCLVLIGASYTLIRIALGHGAEGFEPELMLAVFTATAGFLAGLLSPSPIVRR